VEKGTFSWSTKIARAIGLPNVYLNLCPKEGLNWNLFGLCRTRVAKALEGVFRAHLFYKFHKHYYNYGVVKKDVLPEEIVVIGRAGAGVPNEAEGCVEEHKYDG
jgi:hypothetical protein